MRKIWVKTWMTLDGVFDADTMDQWWNPYDSAERQKYIAENALVFSTRNYEGENR